MEADKRPPTETKQDTRQPKKSARKESGAPKPQVFFLVDADKIIPGGGQRFGRAAAPVAHPVDPAALRLRETSNEHLVLRRLCERRQTFHLLLNKARIPPPRRLLNKPDPSPPRARAPAPARAHPVPVMPARARSRRRGEGGGTRRLPL